MPFLRVHPDDLAAVTAANGLLNAAMAVDDPTSPRNLPELVAAYLRWGWDLEPPERYLYYAPGSDQPVGVLDLEMPTRDNRHLVWSEITVHPDRRRQGHGTEILAETVRRTEAAGRTTIWLGVADDDAGSRAFVEKNGFGYASHDARRRQALAEVDTPAVGRLFDEALVAAADYRLERVVPPVSDEVLAELVDVTAAINDAPMGELTYEDEVFDVDRLRAMQTARAETGDRMYRVVARHRETGRVGGHTFVVVHPLRPTFGFQGDTAVAREHRGHRLGLLVKIETMRWLAEAEPQLETIETFNHADNEFMIRVNEAIGYRLDRIYNMFERNLTDDAEQAVGDAAGSLVTAAARD